MDPLTRSLMMGAAGAGEKIYVEDVFSTWLYTGNGSTQTITNGIDLSGKGGLVWTKPRVNDGVNYHALFDTARGAGEYLSSHLTSGQNGDGSSLTAFTSTGFTLGSSGLCNGNTYTYASWTFRKAAKFFDVVTYTGNGTSQDIAHSLGSTPGCVIIKPTSYADNWVVWHRSSYTPAWQRKLYLNSTSAVIGAGSEFNAKDPTSTVFSVGSDFSTNGSGQTFVAYLFAHDAGGFGDSGNDNVISCGSFTTNGSGVGTAVSLGWEPQWIIYKSTVGSSAWKIADAMRGIPTGGNDLLLSANNANAENSTNNEIDINATGFQLVGNGNLSDTYIYIAIRRGPMKTPTDATKVFDADVSSGSAGTNITTGFPVDMQIAWQRTEALSLASGAVNDRLRGVSSTSTQMILNLLTHSTAAEGTSGTGSRNWRNTGFEMPSYPSSLSNVFWSFRRAPGFFDVVAYTGTGTTQNVSHNLRAAPELIIIKNRSGAYDWTVGSVYLPDAWSNPFSQVLNLNTTAAASQQGYIHSVDSSIFKVVGVNPTGASGSTYIAYLFATCPGVSKCFNYTGTGTTLQIDCGFTNGARFVMIKRTDSTGDWYVWDSARGIISGNDPYLLLNSTAAEVTNTDYIDSYSAGFEISSTAPAAINANGGSYIGLAIA